MNPTRLAGKRGLYAVTPEGLVGAPLLASAARALAGGAVMLQYRAKSRAQRESARALVELCRRHDALLIVNDDPALAADIDADGVHLGRHDESVEQARRTVGADRIIGVSCYDDLARARDLAAHGADYLAFGSMYVSPTKPEAVLCPPEILTSARCLGKPVVAIGGITLARAPELVHAGADLLAVISDLFDASDIEARAAAYAGLFERA
ncbi:MAG TPA: thiamine phosphate synthase [Wenzhouxiangellaceae bacterium]|nr:thiamine phosphate synthase [Wenzhouxiangellaceae bacterium]